MRRIAVVSAALLIVACGPDPNAVLPGMVKTPSSGGTKPAPAGGAGGTTTTPPSSGGTTGTTSAAGGGSGGANPFAGSSGSSGGATGSGGTKSSGGATGSGGSSSASTTYTWGQGSEPCASPKDISCAPSGSGTTNNFNTTTEYCFRTMATIDGWGCSNLSGWTLKVNGQVVTCGGTLPPKLNGLYYFDFIGSSSALTYASMYWYGTCTAGPFPSWSGGSSTSAGGSSGAGGSTGTGGSAGAGGSTGTGGGTSPADAGTNG